MKVSLPVLITLEPSRLTPGKRRDLIEFPWAYFDVCGLKIPTSGGPMMRFLSAGMMYKGLQQSLKRGHTVFYFHPIDVSYEDFPAIGKGRPLYWIIKGKIVEDRIRYILNKATQVISSRTDGYPEKYLREVRGVTIDERPRRKK